MIEKAIAQSLPGWLASDGNLSAYTIKVYPHIAPESAVYPFVTYSTISTAPDRYLNPSAQTAQNFTPATVELQVWADDKQAQDLIAHSLRTILHGRTGVIGTDNVRLSRCIIGDIATFSEREITGSDEDIYRASVICNFSYYWEA